ncbi:MAG: hypothetical protein ACTS5A_01430 [Candidatus Hodgkinia cicadicola]
MLTRGSAMFASIGGSANIGWKWLNVRMTSAVAEVLCIVITFCAPKLNESCAEGWG